MNVTLQFTQAWTLPPAAVQPADLIQSVSPNCSRRVQRAEQTGWKLEQKIWPNQTQKKTPSAQALCTELEETGEQRILGVRRSVNWGWLQIFIVKMTDCDEGLRKWDSHVALQICAVLKRSQPRQAFQHQRRRKGVFSHRFHHIFHRFYSSLSCQGLSGYSSREYRQRKSGLVPRQN